jgi:hypothetical protein
MATSTLGYDNIIDKPATSLSATNEIATLPVGNLAHVHIAKVFRVNGKQTTISVDAGSQVTARQIALIGTNYATGAIRLTASNNAQGGTDVLSGSIDFATDTTYGQILAHLASDTSARYWNIEIEANTLSDSQSNLEFGRLFIGPTLGININLGYPFNVQTVDQSVSKRTLGGQRYVFQRPQYRQVSFIYGVGITESEGFDDFSRTLDRIAGQRQEILLTPLLETNSSGTIDAQDGTALTLQDGSTFESQGTIRTIVDNTLGVRQMVWGFLSSLGPTNFAGYNQLEKEYTLEEAN